MCEIKKSLQTLCRQIGDKYFNEYGYIFSINYDKNDLDIYNFTINFGIYDEHQEKFGGGYCNFTFEVNKCFSYEEIVFKLFEHSFGAIEFLKNEKKYDNK